MFLNGSSLKIQSCIRMKCGQSEKNMLKKKSHLFFFFLSSSVVFCSIKSFQTREESAQSRQNWWSLSDGARFLLSLSLFLIVVNACTPPLLHCLAPPPFFLLLFPPFSPPPSNIFFFFIFHQLSLHTVSPLSCSSHPLFPPPFLLLSLLCCPLSPPPLSSLLLFFQWVTVEHLINILA